MRRTVVVTGASAGVGRAIAREFAKEGAQVVLVARNEEGLRAAAAEVAELGGRAHVMVCDIADAVAVEQVAARTEAEVGPIDVWVNNAMTTIFGPVLDLAPEELQRVTDVTYLGQVYGAQSALRRMVPRDRGHLIQVGSALAFHGIPLQSAYCGAKHAVQGFLDSLRAELREQQSHVVVTSVHLSATNTPQFRTARSLMAWRSQPVPPMYQPEVAARAVVRASHLRRREIWVGMPAVLTVLGSRVAPGFLDWYLGRHGSDSQLLDEREPPLRPDNLFRPLHGDFGAHGPFDDQAHKRSLQAAVSTHRPLAYLGSAAAVAAGVVARRVRNSR